MPVVLVTGGPSVETAIDAVKLGAFRYLSKPVDAATLSSVAQEAMARSQKAGLRKLGDELVTQVAKLRTERADLAGAFESALERIYMAYQPIVSVRSKKILGYEALVRSDEPRLPHPGALFDAAKKLDGLRALSRNVRAASPKPLADIPADEWLFVNLHPTDLNDEALFDASSPLAPHAHRVVLELTERERLESVDGLRDKVAALRALGYRIAIDDIGAGYSSLASLAAVEPEVVKLDMSLVRDVHTTPTKQKLVRSLRTLCTELGSMVVAEGVETADERDALLELGCDLMQGYFFARPARTFPTVSFG
jgi:EAL domain-containing protein (putative c-di-GMP-specific phosphodiesterase class I)